ncbi:hypothetical protein PMAYCL1PPCAC_24234, partial [Pristionchus mayeri]
EWPSLSYFLFSFSLTLDIVFTRAPLKPKLMLTIPAIRPSVSPRMLLSKTRPRVVPRLQRVRPSLAKRRIDLPWR